MGDRSSRVLAQISSIPIHPVMSLEARVPNRSRRKYDNDGRVWRPNYALFSVGDLHIRIVPDKSHAQNSSIESKTGVPRASSASPATDDETVRDGHFRTTFLDTIRINQHFSIAIACFRTNER